MNYKGTPMSNIKTILAVTFVLSAALTGCGASSDDTSASSADPDAPLKVAATPVPHAEVLQFVEDNLAEDAGLDLEIVEFTDYVQPNVALDDESVDANYYQHSVFLEDQENTAGYDFSIVTGVNFQPMGLYSDSIASLSELPDGASVALPNDPVNGSRALLLLAQEGVIGLDEAAGPVPTSLDVSKNPKNLEFNEVEAAQTPRSLEDVDLSAIPGNYAIEAELNPGNDALVVEEAEGSPYVINLVARAENQEDPRIQELATLLNSDEVREFIEETYEGSVVPAF